MSALAGSPDDIHPGAPLNSLHTHGGGEPRAPQWAEPGDVSEAPDDAILTAAQVQQFREQRYLVLDGLYPSELVEQAVHCHTAHFPAPSPEHSAAELGNGHNGFGGIGTDREFPFDAEHDIFNMLTLHPRALSCCAQLLDTADLRVTRSNFGGKYGANGHEVPRASFTVDGPTGDQGIHW